MCINVYITHRHVCIRINVYVFAYVFCTMRTFVFFLAKEHAGNEFWFIELSSLSFVAGCSGPASLPQSRVLLSLLLLFLDF